MSESRPLVAKFLESLMMKQTKNIETYQASDLFREFVGHVNSGNENHGMKLSDTKFGFEVPRYGGISKEKHGCMFYTINKIKLLEFLQSKHYIDVVDFRDDQEAVM